MLKPSTAPVRALDRLLLEPGRVDNVGAPAGCDALVLAQVAASGRALVHVARDDARMAVLAEALAFFDPALQVLTFPAWDCLPYDRVSPNGAVVSRRIDSLEILTDAGAKP